MLNSLSLIYKKTLKKVKFKNNNLNFKKIMIILYKEEVKKWETT